MVKNNPFASYAAGSSSGGGGGSLSSKSGWISTRKSGRDDSAIQKAKGKAAEARKAKNKRGAAAKGKAGGGRRKKKDDYDSDSEESSFAGYSDEEEDGEDDDFIVKSGDEDDDLDMSADEGDWDSEMEDSDGGSKKKKTNKSQKVNGTSKSKSKGKAKTPLSRSARANRRTGQKSWKPPPSSSQNDSEEEEDEIEESSPVPPPRGRKQAVKKRAKSPVVSIDSSDEELDDDDDDMYATSGSKKKAKMVDLDSSSSSDASSGLPSPPKKKAKAAKKKTKSPYFSNGNDSDKAFGEEKKEDEDDENILNRASRKNNNKNASKKRRILDDSDSESEDEPWGLGGRTKTKASNNNNDSDGDAEMDPFDDNLLSDTPKKSSRKRDDNKQLLSPDDYVDEDEAQAIQAAMKASLDDEKSHKRLKKKKSKKTTKTKSGKTGNKKGKGGASSLENLFDASPSEDFPQYKDDMESLADSDDNDVEEDDEVEVYEGVDEEEQTASQVLAQANALSAKIIKIVSGWCGGLEKGNKVKGMILGETDGTLSLGGGGGGGEKGENGKDDAMWISNDTMKEIMPNATLAEYQLLGVNWMALLNRTVFGNGKSKSGKKGGMNVNGILADEMGLGKTVQTIAFLAWLNHQNKEKDSEGADSSAAKQRPHLIVVPASVLSNWMNEFKKFAPDMKVVKYYGNQAGREEIRAEMDQKYVWGNEPLDAVLTTFSYFSSDSNKGDRSFLRKFEFDYLVVDEGHTLKNPKGLRYQNLNKFQTSHRLLLTGTPVQNSPKELMSLLCFLMPLFDTKTKSSKRKRGYDGDEDDDNDGGERMLEYFVHIEGGSGADADAKAYRKLKQLFAPFVLRRKKTDVLGQILPPKTRKVDLVPMDEATCTSYGNIISSHIKARADKSSGAGTAAAQKHLFTTLRKAANHPLLLRNRFLSEEEKDNLARLSLDYHWFGNDSSCTLQLVRDELDKFSDYEVHCAATHMIEESPARSKYLAKYTLMEEDLFCSPKFVRLRTLLPELVREGHRILIFSQWTKILDLMGHLMQSLQMEFLRLDGSTDVSTRQDLIDTFNNDASIPVFLLSTRAGGMGLNLTSADVCILHDLDFNPFNDLQAEDRCHRIGQKKPVTIIKMVTQGTVDEGIYQIQERKSRMNEAIMEGGKKQGKKPNDNKEMCGLANAAVERFLKSPPKPVASTKSKASEPCQPIAKQKQNEAPSINLCDSDNSDN